jgi:hypothetical protein
MMMVIVRLLEYPESRLYDVPYSHIHRQISNVFKLSRYLWK